ncbi:fasciclin domain-containing protein [Ancylomarina sp. DW003]|nr:fasciclin domain-containing protein [Ancylomarina sp. DW003]MDE5422456.1 fasciclin domain-containing protein [Ancylomarina sp. DW003]
MKTRNYKFSLGVFLLMFVFVFTYACNDDDDNDLQPLPIEKSIAEIASGDANFSILVKALAKADLVNTLDGEGTFTVFAPTNDAFEELFDALEISGVDDLTAEALLPILLYHVIGAKAMSTDLEVGYYETLSKFMPGNYGIKLLVDLSSGVKLNNTTNVTTPDIMASNGVIHVIDKVLLPPDVVDLAIANTTFSHLVAAVVKADLATTLKMEGPYTIFAPTDAAFEALFMELGVDGIEDLSAEALTPILLYHVVMGNVRAADVTTGMVPTLNEMNKLDLNTSSGVVINGDSNVVATDVQGTNGVIHVIDKVLIPSE